MRPTTGRGCAARFHWRATGKTVPLALLLAVSSLAEATPPAAEELQPGIYQVVPDGKGVRVERVERSSGGTVDLGKRLSATFGEVTMWSLANNNDRFRVFMQHVPAFATSGQAAVHLAGVCEVISSHTEPDASGRIELIADIRGKANGQNLAAALNVTPLQRRHPGHQLLVNWTSTQERHVAGEPVKLQLEIKNVGATPVRFLEGGQQRGPRDNQFRFIAFSQSGYGPAVPDTGDPTNFGGLAAYRHLEPGNVFRKQVDIGKWFKFKEPGYYQITALYELELYGPDNDRNVVWDDFAVGRCLVHIVDAGEKAPARR